MIQKPLYDAEPALTQEHPGTGRAISWLSWGPMLRLLTTATLAKKHGVHPTIFNGREEAAIGNIAAAFTRQKEEAPAITQKDVEKLHGRIGQLLVERDFSSGVSALSAGREVKSGAAKPP